MSRLAAGFLQQLYVADGHRAIDRLAHVIDGEQPHAYRGERLHLLKSFQDSFIHLSWTEI